MRLNRILLSLAMVMLLLAGADSGAGPAGGHFGHGVH